jgi:hypothetical protein
MATIAKDILFTDVPVLTHRNMIDEELWERVVNRMLSDYKHMKGMNRALAERCLNEALGYLQLCAVADACYSPAPLVDLAWHTLIVYTYHYRELCMRIAGRFIDHEPFDIPDVDYGDLSAKPSETMTAMVASGIAVDTPDLWNGAADCCQNKYGRWCCQHRDKCG